MSQKKPTTNQQLEEMRAMIANLEPGKVVTLDRELQQRNTTLMLMLYGAVAKYGIGMMNESGTLVTAQVPVLQVPANQSLQWEVSEDGKTVMMYIVLNETESTEGRIDKVETSPAGVETGGGSTGQGVNSDVSESVSTSVTTPEALPLPPASTPGEPESFGPLENIEPAIGDEFEDEIEVGLGD